jgi:hypothetical protein
MADRHHGGADVTVLGLGAGARVGIAVALAAALWLAVSWALDWWR